MLTVDDEWQSFINNDKLSVLSHKKEESENFIPKVTDIYVSTQTKIGFLNHAIDLQHLFWKVPIIPYQRPANGVIKKQISR